MTALVREHSYREDREPSAHSARVFLARVGRERARDLLALRRWDRLGRGVEMPAEQVALADLAVRGDDLMAAGVAEGPAVGAMLRRLLAAVVDDPALNERETLLRMCEPESID